MSLNVPRIIQNAVQETASLLFLLCKKKAQSKTFTYVVNGLPLCHQPTGRIVLRARLEVRLRRLNLWPEAIH